MVPVCWWLMCVAVVAVPMYFAVLGNVCCCWCVVCFVDGCMLRLFVVVCCCWCSFRFMYGVCCMWIVDVVDDVGVLLLWCAVVAGVAVVCCCCVFMSCIVVRGCCCRLVVAVAVLELSVLVVCWRCV